MKQDSEPDEPRSDTDATDAPCGIELERFLPYRLNVLANLVSQSLSRVYSRRYGIGVPEWRVLVTLGQFGVMSGKAIGTHSHMHKTKVSRAATALEKRKLVARRVNPADMREALFSLSTSGRAMYDEVTPIALNFAQRLTQALTAEDRTALNRILDKLTQRSTELSADLDAHSGSSGTRHSEKGESR